MEILRNARNQTLNTIEEGIAGIRTSAGSFLDDKLSGHSYGFRTVALYPLRIIFRKDIDWGMENAFGKFEESVRKEKGGIAFSTHLTLGEPLRISTEIIRSPVLRRKKIVIPIAAHRYHPILRIAGRYFDVIFCPLITDNTVQKIQEKPKLKDKILGDKSLNYMRIHLFNFYLTTMTKVVDEEKGIGLVFAQGGRESSLDKETKALQAILTKADKVGLRDFAILIMTVGIKGVKNYDDRSIRGLNLRFCLPFFPKKYLLKLWRTYIEGEFLDKANQQNLSPDQLLFEEFRMAAPQGYAKGQ